MKTSISHLPENKQQEIRRIADIILEVVRPEKIILFGSYAKGEYVENRYQSREGMKSEYISDYDFLVVTEKDLEKPYLQESTIMDRVDRYEPPVNLEICSIDYINHGLGWGQYFFSDIVNEGITLFDTGNFEFAAPRVLTREEEKAKAQDYFNVWFPQSKEFVIDAKNALQRLSLNNSAFYLHQSIESLYYTILLVHTGYKPKTHNIWKLRKKAKAYSEEMFLVFQAETNPEDKRLFELLKRGYIEARYKQKEYEIAAWEVEELIARVLQSQRIVEDSCTNKINSIAN